MAIVVDRHLWAGPGAVKVDFLDHVECRRREEALADVCRSADWGSSWAEGREGGRL